MTAHPRDDTVTLRCSAGLHDICSGCLCRCHDRQPELPIRNRHEGSTAMGAMSELMHEQAEAELAEAVTNLFAEEFCRGSDSLGREGWETLAVATRVFADALRLAAERMQREHGFATEAEREAASASGSVHS